MGPNELNLAMRTLYIPLIFSCGDKQGEKIKKLEDRDELEKITPKQERESSDKIFAEFISCIERHSDDLSDVSSFQRVKRSIRNDLLSHDLINEMIVDEFFTYLDKMSMNTSKAMEAKYEN